MLSTVSFIIFSFVSIKSEEIIKSTSNRIIGGQNVKLGELPYQILIKYNGNILCGGSIINSLTIITAAHCVKNYSYKNFQVIGGTISATSDGEIRSINNVIIHPNYISNNYDFDIALLKINNSYIFNDILKSINLPNNGSELETGTNTIISGWGSLGNGTFPDILQRVEVPIISKQQCSMFYRYINIIITNNMICAGYTFGGKDSCQGDSGGPLVVNNFLHGIVSFGRGCARPFYAGVYTKVSAFHDWIYSNLFISI